MIYRDAELDFAAHGDDVTSVDCEVILDGDRIVVSYEEDESFKVWEGRQDGAGHYRLRARDGDGDGSFHRFADESRMEGSWTESGYAGWWQLALGSAAATP